jgi:hypothetical protein
MTYRRRHRWLRRLALGFAFAAFASPAAAKVDDVGSGSSYVQAGGWSGLVDTATGVPLSAGLVPAAETEITVIPYLSHGVLGEASKSVVAAEPFVPGVTDFPKSVVAAEPFVPGVTDFPTPTAPRVSTPRDGHLDRFAIEQPRVAGQPSRATSSAREWNDSLALAIGGGALALALALGLGIGYLSRPRLAGA